MTRLVIDRRPIRLLRSVERRVAGKIGSSVHVLTRHGGNHGYTARRDSPGVLLISVHADTYRKARA